MDIAVRFPLWFGKQIKNATAGGAKVFADIDYFKQLERYDRAQENGDNRVNENRIAFLSAMTFTDREVDDFHRSSSVQPENAIQYHVVPLVSRVLSEDITVRSVLNIGCKIAYFDAILADRHPDRQFIGLDFMSALDQFNRRYKRENLTFISGYARDLLEANRVGADLIYFSSTATVIRNRELRYNLQNIAKSAKYVIFNEPIFTYPDSTDIVDPSKLPYNKSFLIFTPDIPPGVGLPLDADRTLCFVHNYPAMVVEAGFDVLHFEIKLKDKALPLVQLIAKRTE